MDNYYLEGGVYRLEEFLQNTTAPHVPGHFEYGPVGGHGWSPFKGGELYVEIARHMTASD